MRNNNKGMHAWTIELKKHDLPTLRKLQTVTILLISVARVSVSVMAHGVATASFTATALSAAKGGETA